MRDGRRAALVAAAVLALEAALLVGFCVVYLVKLAAHESSDSTRVLMSVVLLLLMAALLALLARGMASGRAWTRTPTMVWQALLLPVAVGMFQSGRADLGVGVLAVSVVGIVAAIRTRLGDPVR